MLLFVLGLVFPLCYALLVGVTIGLVAPTSSNVFMTIVWSFVIAFIALLVAVGVRFRGKAFIAGSIVGVLLLPLVGAIGLLIVCGGMRI